MIITNQSVVDWTPFMGNNCEHLEPRIWAGGGVSFARHLGKPLSLGLWDDIMFRLTPSSLRIYRPQDAAWTDGAMGRRVIVLLDENDNVADIKLEI